MRIDVEAGVTDTLGEGPVWLAGPACLSRVDIHEPAIVVRDVGTGRERRRRVAAHVGFAVPCAHEGFVAGVGRSLVHFADLEAQPRALAAVEPQHPDNRFNDAAVDARGRLWAGTMSTTRTRGVAALYRVQGDAPPALALPGATISNGLDWNLDATRLYYVDSPTQRIDAIDFDLDRGRLGRRRRPTSLAFGGHDLRDLYVTSARHRLSAGQLAVEPLAGSLLRLRPGVTGRPTVAFGAQAARATLRACSRR